VRIIGDETREPVCQGAPRCRWSWRSPDSSPQQLAAAVRQTAAGERIVDPKLAVLAIHEGVSPPTIRERDVLSLSLKGGGVAEIAHKLNLGEGTVRNYLSTAIQKVNACNRMEAARVADEKGWLWHWWTASVAPRRGELRWCSSSAAWPHFQQAAAFGWHQYLGLTGAAIATHALGTSAPLEDVAKKFGFTPENAVAGIPANSMTS
jgi:DNA-binding CsgD family transcriptional regulator